MSEGSNRLASYATLRHAGYPATRASADLRIPDPSGLEAAFQRHERSDRPDSMLPAYCRDDRHVGAVLQAGGYPTCPRPAR